MANINQGKKKKPALLNLFALGERGIYHPVKQVVNKIQKCLEQILMNRDATGDAEIVFERNPRAER